MLDFRLKNAMWLYELGRFAGIGRIQALQRGDHALAVRNGPVLAHFPFAFEFRPPMAQFLH
jgi:hypothetical protein